jgi:hypothetical protein
MSTDVNTGLGGGIRKASPEALAIMMKNLKQNNNQKKVWVPNGGNKKEGSKTSTKKIFF